MTDTKNSIAFINPWAGRTIGPNVGMRQLVEEACRRGHEVHIFAHTRDDYLDQKFGSTIHVHILPDLGLAVRSRTPFQLLSHFWKAFVMSRRIGHMLHKINADILCVNGENMLFAPRAAKVANIPCVVIVRGARFSKLGILGRVYFGIQHRWVNLYFGVSQVVVDGLQVVGVPPSKCRKVCNGVDTDIYTPGPKDQAILRDLGITQNEITIGAVCHYVPRKGVHHLIRAMARLVPHWPNLKCVLVGGILNSSFVDEIQYAENLPKLAEECGVSDRIIFAGERTDIPALMKSFDIVVHPSETESFGRTIAEAMACGKPVVGFDIEAIGELIDPEITGYLAPPFDETAMAESISQLLGDPKLRERFGKAGRQKTLREYDLKKNINLAIDSLEECIFSHM